MNIADISKNMGVTQNVSFRVIDRTTGQIVSEHTGHNQATNTMLLGIAHYLKGDGVLNQASSMLGDYVPKYISLGTMGLLNQDEDENGLPTGIGETEQHDGEPDESYEERRYNDYKEQQPGYGADGYDPSENNGRSQLGLGPVYAGVPVKCELISSTFPRSKISYRQIIPETDSERSETIDIVYSAMISTGALAQFRGDSDHIFITEAGLWSTPDWRNSTSNGLLAGYRMMPTDTEKWDMTDPANRKLVQESILRVGINQVVQVIWKLQIGSIYDLIGNAQDLRNYVTHLELEEELTSYVQYEDIKGFLKFKGYVDVKQDLPNNAEVYDMYKAIFDGVSYFYNEEEEWELLYDTSKNGVGRNTEGQTFVYDDTEYTGGIGSEQFNSYKQNKSIGEYSHAEGNWTTAFGGYSHAEGQSTHAIGYSSHAEGASTRAVGNSSHAEGSGTSANSNFSHAEGYYAVASGEQSHAEGLATVASGTASHAEGKGNGLSSNKGTAEGNYSHCEGNYTYAKGNESHAEGYSSIAIGHGSHAEGYDTIAYAGQCHAEGNSTVAGKDDGSGSCSHAEGLHTTASGTYSHAEGTHTIASHSATHAEGEYTEASGVNTHAEGFHTKALYDSSHAEGKYTIAAGASSHTEGNGTKTCNPDDESITGTNAHAEGYSTAAYGSCAHAEGSNTVASDSYAHAEGSGGSWEDANGIVRISGAHGSASHSEGSLTVANGNESHAEGFQTIAQGARSHAEGNTTVASGADSHSEGYYTRAIGDHSFAGGSYSTANAICSFAHGDHVSAQGVNSTVFGKYNSPNATDIFQIGNGSSETASNALAVDTSGNTRISGRYTDSTGLQLMPIVSLTQAEYDALDQPLQNVMYCIHS